MREAEVAQGQLPQPTETPTSRAAGPGAALAGARVPGSPTLPDWDPSALTRAVAQVAAELFMPTSAALPATSVAPAMAQPAQTPTVPGGPPGVAPALPAAEPSVAGLTAPAAPASVNAPAPQAVAAAPVSATAPQAPAAPSDVASPFGVGLSFDTLDLLAWPNAQALPVLDGGYHSPLEGAAPYWMAPSASETKAPAVPALTANAFQIDALPALSLKNAGGAAFDPLAIRREFPILEERVHGKRLVWLDNAATTQKPQPVIDRLKYFYEHENSNVHRAAHTLAARATDAYESARETVRRFINAPTKNDIVFVRGTTEGINLVAQAWGRQNVGEGDEVLITWLEHHANIVPWHQLCLERKAKLKVAPVDDTGQVILGEYERLLSPRTKLVAFSQVSNALGTITPAKEMIDLAHRHGAKVLLDGAQAVSHLRIDVQLLNCDFFVFSGHKVFAPTGIGVVFGKSQILEAMQPWQGGGNMIQDVTFERVIYQGPPARFEAGTGNIADAVGLGTALDWLTRVGLENVSRYEHELLEYGTERLLTVPGLKLIGTAPDKAGVLSFVLAGQKTEEIGGMLDKEGIAVRSGHHCAQPILRRFGLEATVRASLAPYNTCEDLDILVDALKRLQAGYGAPDKR